MERLTEKKSRKLQEKNKNKSKKGKVVLVVFIIILIGGALAYYFFFYEKGRGDFETVSEIEKSVIEEEIRALINSFISEVKKESINDTGEISDLVIPENEKQIQKNLFPDGWLNIEGASIKEINIIDYDVVEVMVVFPLNSPYGQKYMYNLYKVKKKADKWLVSEIISQTKEDHGINMWPVIEDQELFDLQKNIKQETDSYRLNPLETAKKAALLNGFWADDKYEQITDTYIWVPAEMTYQATVKVEHDKQIFYLLMTQPYVKGYWGIWSIESISRDKPNI